MKICVFVDYQNVYMDARTAFGFENKGHTWGQIDPLLFGQLFCAKDSPNISSKSKVLSQVRIYTGVPNAELASETNAAYLRQKASWEQIEQVEVVDRPLQYIKGQPPRQKGVDVAMALDIVTLGSRGEYDCAAVVSTDTDLLPAIEYIKELGSPSIEVACWWSKRLHKRLRLREGWIWCHRLSSEDYNSVCDSRDYNIFRPKKK